VIGVNVTAHCKPVTARGDAAALAPCCRTTSRRRWSAPRRSRPGPTRLPRRSRCWRAWPPPCWWPRWGCPRCSRGACAGWCARRPACWHVCAPWPCTAGTVLVAMLKLVPPVPPVHGPFATMPLVSRCMYLVALVIVHSAQEHGADWGAGAAAVPAEADAARVALLPAPPALQVRPDHLAADAPGSEAGLCARSLPCEGFFTGFLLDASGACCAVLPRVGQEPGACLPSY